MKKNYISPIMETINVKISPLMEPSIMSFTMTGFEGHELQLGEETSVADSRRSSGSLWDDEEWY